MAPFGLSALSSLLRGSGTGRPAQAPPASWQRPIGQGWEAPYTVRYASNLDDGPNHGAPLGGFGAGCIGRGPDGSFNLWHLDGGEHWFGVLPDCQFALFEHDGTASRARALAMAPERDDSRPEASERPLGRWQWLEGRGSRHLRRPLPAPLVRLPGRLPRRGQLRGLQPDPPRRLPAHQLPGGGVPLAAGQPHQKAPGSLVAAELAQHRGLVHQHRSQRSRHLPRRRQSGAQLPARHRSGGGPAQPLDRRSRPQGRAAGGGAQPADRRGGGSVVPGGARPARGGGGDALQPLGSQR